MNDLDLFEGACCSLSRHQELLELTKKLELGEEKKDNES